MNVEQVVEPFARVGAYFSHSLDQIDRFQRWWNDAREVVDATAFAEGTGGTKGNPDLAARLAAIAAEEPIDVQPSSTNAADAAQAIGLAGVHVRRLDPRVGSAPMVVTLREAYLPYDLSASDLKLWNAFPTSAEPFCVRSRADELAWAGPSLGIVTADPIPTTQWSVCPRPTVVGSAVVGAPVINAVTIATEGAARPTAMREGIEPEDDAPVAKAVGRTGSGPKIVSDELLDQIRKASSFAPRGSADCWLDEIVWHGSRYHRGLAAQSRNAPHRLGAWLAVASLRPNEWITQAALRLASMLPPGRRIDQRESAGRALLARAGAIESAEPVATAELTIAEAPGNRDLR